MITPGKGQVRKGQGRALPGQDQGNAEQGRVRTEYGKNQNAECRTKVRAKGKPGHGQYRIKARNRVNEVLDRVRITPGQDTA